MVFSILWTNDSISVFIQYAVTALLLPFSTGVYKIRGLSFESDLVPRFYDYLQTLEAIS